VKSSWTNKELRDRAKRNPKVMKALGQIQRALQEKGIRANKNQIRKAAYQVLGIGK
jgi:hypothetical protein